MEAKTSRLMVSIETPQWYGIVCLEQRMPGIMGCKHIVEQEWCNSSSEEMTKIAISALHKANRQCDK